MEQLALYLLPVLSYLIGSIPWGLLLTRMGGYEDIRLLGSGNIGATNVRRIAGGKLAFLTLVGDMGKGAVPVWLSLHMVNTGPEGEFYICLVGLAALSGHLFPIFLKFKCGGKGVATAAGCFMVLSPLAGLAVSSVFFLAVCVSKRVSVGSMSGAAVLPPAVWIQSHSLPLTGYAVLTAAAILIRHRENIRRLLSGSEPLLWNNKK